MMESLIVSEKRRFVLVKSSCMARAPFCKDYNMPENRAQKGGLNETAYRI